MTDLERKLPLEESLAAEVEHNGMSTSDEVPMNDEAQRRRILRKVDWRVVPSLAVMYLVSFIDRSNSKKWQITLTDVNG